jgi:hypothetical protein
MSGLNDFDQFESILDKRLEGFEKLFDLRLQSIQDGVGAMKDTMAIFVEKVSNMHKDYVPRTEVERDNARFTVEIDGLTKKVETLEAWRNYLTGAIALLVGAVGVLAEHFWK